MSTTTYGVKSGTKSTGYTRIASASSVKNKETRVDVDIHSGTETADSKVVTVGEPDDIERPDIADLPKAARLDLAKSMMQDQSPEYIPLEVGDLQKLSPSMLIEKTEDGFVLYHVE